MLVAKLKVMMVESIEEKLELKLVPGMESVLLFNSKVESMQELTTVYVYVLA